MNRRELLGAAGAALASGFLPWPATAQPGNTPKLLGYRRTNWSQDPYAYGSYSYIAKGSSREDHKTLAEPLGRLFFAGEATNRERNSSVHAALESGRSVAQDLLSRDHQSIGIVGAGIAGLVAAHALGAAGRAVHVIEARDRIGGRIHTDTSSGVALDLGASWIHGTTGNPLTEVTDAAGMRKVVTNSSWIARDRGKRLSGSDLPDWISEISYNDNTAGASAASINRRAYRFSSDYTGDEVIFPDGYAAILDSFAGAYETSLGDAVSRIESGDSGVRVVSEKATRDFDAVVVTLPLGVLKKGTVAFEPALPAAKRESIDRLGMGTLDKVYLQFDQVFWDPEPHLLITPFSGQPRGHYNNWINFQALIGQPVLAAFNGGPAALALSSESDETVVQGALSTIYRAYGLGG